MWVAIYGRKISDKDVPYLQQLLDQLAQHAFRCVIHKHYYQQIENKVAFKQPVEIFESHADIIPRVEYLISLGGDGTLLDTVTLVRDSQLPVLAINFGRLGFLSTTSREDIPAAINALLNRSYSIDSRTLLHLDSNKPLFNDCNYALNEFTIQRKDSSSMITVRAYLNGELLNAYWADGLIVATPTGSTAYSLSCGGPIIFPASENFVITPVAPHNLNVRPIVVSSDSVLSFEVEGRSNSFLCTLDSRSESIDSSYQLAVRKEDFHFNLVRVNDINFLNTLRSKLGWGLDQRN